MKITNKSLIGIVVVLTVATAAFASTQSMIQASYDKVGKAMRTGKFSVIKKALMESGTKDFKMISKGGQSMGAEQALAMMENEMKMVSSVRTYDCKITKVVQKGKSADVWENTHMVMMLKPMGKSKKNSTLDMHSTSKDHWVMVGKEWKMQSMMTLSESAKMDGKPFDPTKGMGGAGGK